MEFSRNLFLVALAITLFLLSTIFLVGSALDGGREEVIDEEMQGMYNSLNEMQTFLLMSEIYGDEMACLVFDEKLRELDRSMWDLGRKIEQYRTASEEFRKSEYYARQKRLFNENEVFYMMLLTKLKQECGYDQAIIAFFYRNAEVCRKCDDQSFVLSDINRDIDDEVSIFSFDLDLNLTSIDVLKRYYNLTELPCLVIDEQTFCGMMSKREVLEKACISSPKTSVCDGLEA